MGKPRKLDKILDEVKDAIDEIGKQKPEKQREAAKDLIEYIELHYLHAE